MKTLKLWGGQVWVVLTDRADDNMRDMGELSDAVAANQERALARAGATPQSAVRVLVKYDRDDFTRYFLTDDTGKLAMTWGEDGTTNDGILTTRQNGLAIFLPLADCLGAVLYDSTVGALMMVHAGRHNIEQDGLSRTVEFMTRQVGSQPENITAWFSPSAGAKNYPLYNFDGQSLQDVAIKQLTAAGVSAKNITKSNIDTTTNSNYFSYSQGDKSQRFAIVAKLD
jgi:hypothetical protein